MLVLIKMVIIILVLRVNWYKIFSLGYSYNIGKFVSLI